MAEKTDTGGCRLSVRRELRAANQGKCEGFSRWYDEPEGLHLLEKYTVTSESDIYNGAYIRESFDNGKTFSEWKDTFGNDFEVLENGDEIMRYDFIPNIYDPASSNYVTCGLFRYFIDPHKPAYDKEYSDAIRMYTDHCYLVYKRPDGSVHQQFIKYEDGPDFEDGDPRDDGYFNHNESYFSPVKFASNGDLLFAIGANILSCCRILGIDPNSVFPSCPRLMNGVILVRGHWNSEKEEYELTYSRPALISDLQSSRGVCEPCVAELRSGRILIVFRGSNWSFKNWHTRVNSATPSYKWFLISDDGGKTFSPVMPWHFDTREVVYSSATISDLFRSRKNGKLYWIGNITDPTKNDGNFPRYPLQICEVNDEYGYLIKDTLTEIDTRRDGESERVQLSNFNTLQNRETGDIEVRLTKIGQHEGENPFAFSECWTYYITPDD